MRQVQVAAWLCVLMFLSACIPADPATMAVYESDKLAEIMARGALVIATDADYEPQSKLIEASTPDPNTKCGPAQYTSDQMTGFDVEVAVEVASHLGVEPCFVTPSWSQLVAGHWGENWDIHVGSVAITRERMRFLYFSQPYYATPTVLLVHKQNKTFKQPEDLSRKRIGVCVGCTFEAYLNGTLEIPGEKLEFRIQNAEIVGYENEEPAVKDLSVGDGIKLDAVLTILPLAQRAINAGEPIRILDEPLLFTYASITLDRYGKRDPLRLLNEISKIITELHSQETLKQLSLKYQEQDLTQEASRYDISVLQQFLEP